MTSRTALSITLCFLAALVCGVLASPAPQAHAAGTNSIQTPDNSGSVLLDQTAVVLDATGKPVISYATSTDLAVLHCGDANCSSGNTITNVDPVGDESSIRLDGTGKPVVAYYDGLNSDLKVVHCGDANCTTGNTFVSPDTAGNVGGFTSLALDSGGKPVVSYYDASNGDLKVLHCGDVNCSSGNSIQSPDTGGNVGGFTSLSLDSLGNPIVSYYDATNGDLKILHCGNANCSVGNSITSPDTTGDVGLYTSLALDASGNPVVSYSANNPGQEHPKVLHCGSPNCSAGNVITDVDPGSTIFWGTSLRLDAAGNPVVAYNDSGFDQIKVLHCGNPNCNSGNTITFDFDNTTDQGFVASVAIDTSGKPVVGYATGSGDLNVLHCGDAICSRNCPIPNLALPAAGCTEFKTTASLTVSAPSLSFTPLSCNAAGVADFTRTPVGDSNFNGKDDVGLTMYFISGYIDCPGPYASGSSIPSTGMVEELTNTASGVLEFPAEGDFTLCITVYSSTTLGTVRNCPESLGPGGAKPLKLHCVFPLSLQSGSCTLTAVSHFYNENREDVAQVTSGTVSVTSDTAAQPLPPTPTPTPGPVGGVGLPPAVTGPPGASGHDALFYLVLAGGGAIALAAAGALLGRTRPRRR